MEPDLNAPEKLPGLVPFHFNPTATAVSPALAAVRQWLAEFVMRPHPQLHREGPVCPFVEPAIRQGTLVFFERKLEPPATVPLAIRELHECVRAFLQLEWPGTNRKLHAMIAVFPELTDTDAAHLHHAHNEIKKELLSEDVMMQPFHPHCADVAARGDDFRAFRAPVPMVAIRRLAFHDILFVHQDKDRFWHYARRFGKRYQTPASLDPLMVERYRAAVARHGTPNQARQRP